MHREVRTSARLGSLREKGDLILGLRIELASVSEELHCCLPLELGGTHTDDTTTVMLLARHVSPHHHAGTWGPRSDMTCELFCRRLLVL